MVVVGVGKTEFFSVWLKPNDLIKSSHKNDIAVTRICRLMPHSIELKMLVNVKRAFSISSIRISSNPNFKSKMFTVLPSL